MDLVRPLLVGDATHQRLRLDVTGQVQGVGFRPFIHRLAFSENLAGFVRNTSDGVSIEIEGPAVSLERFLHRIEAERPPHAVVHRCQRTKLAAQGGTDFSIAPSIAAAGGDSAPMRDLATCPDCLREVLDPYNRRYGYPFTTCAHCGPRYSIIEALPYDRERTTMRAFPLCRACSVEYHDPNDRRFHAESIACPACGPQLVFWNAMGQARALRQAALLTAAAALRCGMILALKGLGGFQLLVDAANETAVARLRAAKRRPRKPFAVMVRSLLAAEAVAEVGPVERRLLDSSEAPIVLLRARPGARGIAPNVAPGNHGLGIMLPYTPLHHLLLREVPGPVVATSGNLGDEPILADERDARETLRGIADCFLVHDRPILRPVDDSVVRVMAGRDVVLRRARGYAATPLAHPVGNPAIAFGGQQKNTIAVGSGGRLFLGPHIGDLGSPRTRAAFSHASAALPKLYRIEPGVVACDAHPDFHSTHAAHDRGLPVVPVPHHLAHVLAAMVDHGLEGPVLGVAWDGSGYGGDGTVWGGEFLAVGTTTFRRVAHLHPFRLPGNEAAVREPRRAAAGVLHAIEGEAWLSRDALPPVAAFSSHERTVLARMLGRGFNAPLTSSAGRLFDAVASLLGLCQVASFEGEAAMAVESAADRAARIASLPPAGIDDSGGRLVVNWRPLLAGLIELRRRGEAPEPLAAALHHRLADALVTVAQRVGIARVVLTGGCFQNAYLTELAVGRLRAAGLVPYWHHHIPPNDGGLAAGQVAYAAQPRIEETG